MLKIEIPHAKGTFVDYKPPLRILHVVTDLAENPLDPGFKLEAWHEFMQALDAKIHGRDGYNAYVIHSPDNPKGDKLDQIKESVGLINKIARTLQHLSI
jgi:hypothetical protein